MIDFTKENLLTFAQAARLVPSDRSPGHVSTHSPARWARKGSRGVVLESRRIGGTWFTSTEALQRFSDRLSALDFEEAVETDQEHSTPAATARSHRSAEDQLNARRVGSQT